MYVITEINNRLELKAYRSNVLPAQSEIVLLRFKFFFVNYERFYTNIFTNFISQLYSFSTKRKWIQQP